MNEMKWTEEQLRSWTPRRPSSEIKKQLFGVEQREERTSWRALPWLIPAAACLVAAFVIVKFGAPTGFLKQADRSSGVFAMIGSNSVSFSAGMDFAAVNAGGNLDRNFWATAVCRFTNEQFVLDPKSSSTVRSITNLLQ